MQKIPNFRETIKDFWLFTNKDKYHGRVKMSVCIRGTKSLCAFFQLKKLNGSFVRRRAKTCNNVLVSTLHCTLFSVTLHGASKLLSLLTVCSNGKLSKADFFGFFFLLMQPYLFFIFAIISCMLFFPCTEFTCLSLQFANCASWYSRTKTTATNKN